MSEIEDSIFMDGCLCDVEIRPDKMNDERVKKPIDKFLQELSSFPEIR